MIRVIFGAAVAAVAMFVIGFIFFGPLGLIGLATTHVGDIEAAAVQQALAANLPHTGTYFVPAPESSAAQTVMFGRGPIATIHYNTGGFAAMDPATLLVGLIFNFIIALVMGLALLGIDSRVLDLGSRAKTASILAVAGVAFSHLSEPIYLKHDWPYFIYVFVADGLMLIAAGIILAWFLPRPPVAAAPVVEDAPAEV